MAGTKLLASADLPRSPPRKNLYSSGSTQTYQKDKENIQMLCPNSPRRSCRLDRLQWSHLPFYRLPVMCITRKTPLGAYAVSIKDRYVAHTIFSLHVIRQ